MEMNNEPIENIQSVEAPPFLYTRIQQRIKNEQAARMPGKMTWAVGLSFLLILCINIGAVVSASRADHAASNLVKTLNLMQDNTIYK
jgi:hypothetical protein